MTDYRKAAETLITNLERESSRSGESLEQFYRGLRTVIDELRERLEVAYDELDKSVASDIVTTRAR